MIPVRCDVHPSYLLILTNTTLVHITMIAGRINNVSVLLDDERFYFVPRVRPTTRRCRGPLLTVSPDSIVLKHGPS